MSPLIASSFRDLLPSLKAITSCNRWLIVYLKHLLRFSCMSSLIPVLGLEKIEKRGLTFKDENFRRAKDAPIVTKESVLPSEI